MTSRDDQVLWSEKKCPVLFRVFLKFVLLFEQRKKYCSPNWRIGEALQVNN